jgi:hypothetical protein
LETEELHHRQGILGTNCPNLIIGKGFSFARIVKLMLDISIGRVRLAGLRFLYLPQLGNHLHGMRWPRPEDRPTARQTGRGTYIMVDLCRLRVEPAAGRLDEEPPQCRAAGWRWSPLTRI